MGICQEKIHMVVYLFVFSAQSVLYTHGVSVELS